MATDKRRYTLRIQGENFDKIQYIANMEKRSLAMHIEYLIENEIEQYESTNGKIDLDADAKKSN